MYFTKFEKYSIVIYLNSFRATLVLLSFWESSDRKAEYFVTVLNALEVSVHLKNILSILCCSDQVNSIDLSSVLTILLMSPSAMLFSFMIISVTEGWFCWILNLQLTIFQFYYFHLVIFYNIFICWKFLYFHMF